MISSCGQQEVAIKRIPFGTDGQIKALAEREVGLLTKLNHPNIIRFKGALVEDGACFIVMEYCRGGDLFQRMEHLRNKG